MADTDYAKLEEKIKKGEALTKEELKDVMSQPTEASEGADDVDWDKITGGKDEDNGKSKDTRKDDKAEGKADVRKADEGKQAGEVGNLEPGKDAKEIPGSGQKLDPFQQREKDRIEKTAHKEELREELGRIERGEKTTFAEEPNKYSLREKAYFQEVLAERKARQKAELDLETFKFQQIKKTEADKVKPKAEPEKEPEPAIADDEFVTGAELKKMMKQAKAAPGTFAQPAPQPIMNLAPYLKVCEKVVREKYDDMEDVLELYNKIISDNPVYLKRIGDAMNAGDNAVELAYNIIKNDPSFDDNIDAARATVARRNPKPKTPATEKASQEFEEKEKRVKQNLDKPKTTGSFNGGSESGNEDEMTAQDLLNMSDAQFAKIPKSKRVKLLQQFGM